MRPPGVSSHAILGNMKADQSSSEEIAYLALTRVARGGSLIFVSMVICRFLGFARQFVIIHLVSPRDYGFFSLGMTVIVIFELFSVLGLQLGSQRYIAYLRGKGDDNGIRGIISATNHLLTISVGISTLLCLALAGPLSGLFGKPEMRDVLIWLAPIIPATVMMDTLTSYFLGLRKVEMKVWFQNLGFYFLSLVCVLALVWRYRDLYSVLMAMTLSYALIAAASLAYYFRFFPARLRQGAGRPMTRELLAFSLPLFVLALFNNLIMQTDTLMLGYYADASLVGMYNAAFLLMSIPTIFVTAVTTIFMPVASEMVAKGNLREVRQLYSSVTKWLFIFTLPAFLVLFCYPSQVLEALFGGSYPQAARALQLLSLGFMASTIVGPNGMSLLALGKPRILMMSNGAATLANVALNAALIPHWGMSGAALASFISFIVLNLFNSTFLYRTSRIHPFNRDYLLPVLYLTVSAAILYWPLLKLAGISNWLTALYYPLYLGLGLFMLKAGGHIDSTDARFLLALKKKFTGR